MQIINLNKPTCKIAKSLLNTAGANVVTQAGEQFIIEHADGKQTTCNLKTLNALINEQSENAKIIANLYQDENAKAINIFAPVLVNWF